MIRRLATALVAAGVMLAAAAPYARAQDVISKEAATELKASFVRDLDTLRGKFVGLSAAARKRRSCARCPTRRRSSSTSTKASRTPSSSSSRSTPRRSPASAR
jgi:hypothetical protein